MANNIVYIFGNPDLANDSMPIRLVPRLQAEFPNILFEIKDPNEEWDIPEDLTIIDTTFGIKKVAFFEDLDSFETAPRLSMHDFDALANLRYMKKLGKLKSIKIIGIPPDMDEKEALFCVNRILNTLVSSKSKNYIQ